MMIPITMFYFLHNPHVVLRKYMQHSKATLPSVFSTFEEIIEAKYSNSGIDMRVKFLTVS
jgi:hypothetical protein